MCKNTKQSDKVFNVIADGVATWVVWYAFNIPCISSMKISKSILLQVRILLRNNLFATERLRWRKKEYACCVSHNKLNQHYLILWSKGGRSFSKVFRSLYLVLIDFDGWLTDRPTDHFHANRIIYACGVQVTHKCSSWNMKLNKSSMHYSKPDKLLNHSIEYISLLFWSTATTTTSMLFVLWVI